MHSSNHSSEAQNHIARFNTDLLSQIIELEVSEVIAGLVREGYRVEDNLLHVWSHAIRDMLIHMMIEEEVRHTMMPQDIQQALDTMLQDLRQEFIDRKDVTNAAHTETALRERYSSFLQKISKKQPS